MKKLSILFLALFLISACGNDKDLNQGPPPPQQPPTQPGGTASGSWGMVKFGDLLAYCQQAVGNHVVFCGCYAIRVSQKISPNDYDNNAEQRKQIHQQLQSDQALAQCYTGQEGSSTTNSDHFLSLLR